MRRREVEQHFEELVLEGLPSTFRYCLSRGSKVGAVAVTCRWGLPPLMARSNEVSNFEAAQGSSPEKIGTKVARSVYGGLKR